MKIFRMFSLALLGLTYAAGVFAQSAPTDAGSSLTVGLLMVDPYNDHGWCQANFDGVK